MNKESCMEFIKNLFTSIPSIPSIPKGTWSGDNCYSMYTLRTEDFVYRVKIYPFDNFKRDWFQMQYIKSRLDKDYEKRPDPFEPWVYLPKFFSVLSETHAVTFKTRAEGKRFVDWEIPTYEKAIAYRDREQAKKDKLMER